MSRASLTIEQLLPMLQEAPTRIATLTANLSAEEARMRPAPEEWSANEVLAHLRACADVWGTCMKRMIEEEQPTWRAINPVTWIKQTDYLDLAFSPSLAAYTVQRNNLLTMLSPLPRDAWSRSAIVTGAGKPLQPTVLSYAQRLSTHERSHIKQIGRLAKTITHD